MRRFAYLILLLQLFVLPFAFADEIRPVLLDIKERDNSWIDIIWKVPAKGDQVLAITPKLPASLSLLGTANIQFIPGARIERATYKNSAATLTGQSLAVEGLLTVPTAVLVQIQLKNGVSHSAILRAGEAEYIIPQQASKWEVAKSYWRMGTEHILEGFDHLLFVFALLLIVADIMPLLKAVTAFTVAHSITLALATLGLVNIPAAPTEAVIALSIVFLAAEIVHKHQGIVGITERSPWVIAFIFGLFHGLGFAGALSEIGVPAHEVPLALLMFNVGVETGQILFIMVVLGLLAVLRTVPIKPPAGMWRVLPYSIGSLAGFWTIERSLSFL